MTKRISRSILLVAFAAFTVCFVFMLWGQYKNDKDALFERLRTEAAYICRGVEEEGDAYFASPVRTSSRVTHIAPDGSVLYDSAAAAPEMENHADREEIAAAFADGVGQSERRSDTLGVTTVNYAVRIADGSVIRVSAGRQTLGALLLSMLAPVAALVVLVSLCSVGLASGISARIVAPINEIDPENPDIDERYPEIAPLLHKISRQNELIRKQMADMKRHQEEFRAITENMDEGFILIDRKTDILSYNASALRLLGREHAGDSGSVFALNRAPAFRAAVGEALSGRHNEKTLETDGRTYTLIANPVTENEQTDGAVIVILDVTEKRQREQMRREFTSNVSHEMKTPLTSIYGISEMLMNDLVKPEDVHRFAQSIHSESGRMISLIDDTIRLSQLDEESIPYERENVDLYSVAEETVARMRPEAAKRNISISLEGESHVINGIRTILGEIVSNLCDNAIKYNRDGGSVRVSVTKENGRVVLAVADTGIGIPKEHLDRVFERFYRVDKSHSREIGGTGLGLSIVKHAAAYHGAEVKIESRVGEGTTVRILF
ncbi:MAG: ATP-binding protein [Eubacteriales bacterium]